MLSASVTLHRKAKDGADGTSINIKGKCMAHYADYTAASSSSFAVGDIILLDSSSDMPAAQKASGTLAAAPSVAQCITATPTWKVWQANNGDGYVDGDGYMWTAGTDCWVNSGQIKGEKGDTGPQGNPGADGEDAVGIILTGTPLIFDTGTDGIVPSTTAKTAYIKVMQGGANVTGSVTNVTVDGCVNYSYPDSGDITKAAVSGEKMVAVKMKGSKISQTAVADPSDSSQTVNLSVQAGYVQLKIVYGGTAYYAQIPFQVNLTKLCGTFYHDNTRLTSTLAAYKADADTQFSQIDQTFGEISLKVGSQAGRRANLLRGTACLRQDEGWAKMSGGEIFNNTFPMEMIEATSGYNGENCLHCRPYNTGSGTSVAYHLAGFHWIGGGAQGNIPVTKGKQYTLSFWAKAATAASVEFVLETIWQGSQTDASRPAGYAGPGKYNDTADTGPGEIFTANADGTWQLFTRTIDIPSDASYSFLEVCIFARSKVASMQDAYISRPMMEEGTTYNGWTLSPDDMELTCGNLLPSTRSLAKGAVLEAVNGTITSGDYEGCSSIHADASSAYKNVLQWNMASLGLEAAEDYTLTFMAKGTGTVKAYFYRSNGSGRVMVEKAGDTAPTWASDGYAAFGLTPQWQRFRVHWSPALAAYLPQYCLLRAETGAQATFAQPKLERGAVATDYTEKASDGSEELLATGIDIESKKITVTANMFEIQNNSGETTATVDENGRLSVSDGDFTGTVRAQNFFHNVHILGSTEKWYYITYSYSDQLEVGKYYLASVVDNISEDWDGELCIGAADLVLLPRDTAGATRYVVLPSAKDYEGKTVEIIDTGYTNVSGGLGDIVVSAADGGNAKFVKGVYTSGVGSSATSYTYEYGTGEYTGKRIRFIALKIGSSYYWMETEYIPGHS